MTRPSVTAPGDYAAPAVSGAGDASFFVGRRVLVVGASSGIGRAVGIRACSLGAMVALAARRSELVEAAAGEAGPGATALTCDTADDASCKRVVEEAIAALGGLDTVVYAAGTSHLAPVSTTSAGDWHELVSTNLVGAALVSSAALGALRSADLPVVCLLSSHSVGRPWPGLVSYAATKAALDELARGLRVEEPWLRVVRVAVGPTITGFADAWDPVRSAAYFESWASGGYLVHRVLGAEETAAGILGALADRAGGDDVLVIGEEQSR